MHAAALRTDRRRVATSDREWSGVAGLPRSNIYLQIDRRLHIDVARCERGVRGPRRSQTGLLHVGTSRPSTIDSAMAACTTAAFRSPGQVNKSCDACSVGY